MIITIDGPASAGKGTLASYLAERYRLAYFDTGMVYRAVGLEMLLQGLDTSDAEAAARIAGELTFQKMVSLSQNPEFRGPQGGKNASIVSAYPKVRSLLLIRCLRTAHRPTGLFMMVATPARSSAPMPTSSFLLRPRPRLGRSAVIKSFSPKA